MNNDIMQNLKDAGCNSTIKNKIIALLNSKDTDAALNMLAKHRIRLLYILHDYQKKIDCLDFLVFSLKEKR